MLIDLHGYEENEAFLTLDAFLFEFEESDENECTIITGNGIVIKPMVIDELEKRLLNWKYENNNEGAIIVLK